MIVKELVVNVEHGGAMAEAHTYTRERRGRERFNVGYSVTIRSSRGLVDGEPKNMSGTGALL